MKLKLWDELGDRQFGSPRYHTWPIFPPHTTKGDIPSSHSPRARKALARRGHVEASIVFARFIQTLKVKWAPFSVM